MINRDASTLMGQTVNSEGAAKFAGVAASPEHHANHEHQKAYSTPFAVDPDGAGDCFYYLKNLDAEDLVIEGIKLSLTGADEIQVVIGDIGTAAKTSGADISPVNLTSGSGEEPNLICYSNTADGAVDITGLSGGKITEIIYTIAATGTGYYNFECDIILPKNKTFSLYSVGGDVVIRGTVIFTYHEAEMG